MCPTIPEDQRATSSLQQLADGLVSLRMFWTHVASCAKSIGPRADRSTPSKTMSQNADLKAVLMKAFDASRVHLLPFVFLLIECADGLLTML